MVDARQVRPTLKSEQLPMASEAVCRAAYAGDFTSVRRLVSEGAELNVFGPRNESLLENVVCFLLNQTGLAFQASDMARLLIALGANPSLMRPDESSPLVPAMLFMDVPILEALLEGGADPNPPGGICGESNFYDWAVFDYEAEVWIYAESKALSESSEADAASEDSWLEFLDRKALEHGFRRPDHLRLLRRFGARSAEELESE